MTDLDAKVARLEEVLDREARIRQTNVAELNNQLTALKAKVDRVTTESAALGKTVYRATFTTMGLTEALAALDPEQRARIGLKPLRRPATTTATSMSSSSTRRSKSKSGKARTAGAASQARSSAKRGKSSTPRSTR